MRSLLLFSLFCLFFSCEKEDPNPVLVLTLSTDKAVALEQNDQVQLFVEALDKDLKVLENLEIDFYVDGQILDENSFFPETRGTYELSAQYRDLKSNIVKVKVVNLKEDLQKLFLDYDGYQYLTTNPWSISGNFSFKAQLEGELFPINSSEIQLQLDGENQNSLGAFQFDKAGEYLFNAAFQGETSEFISIQVREEQAFPALTIPLVFHSLGVEMTSSEVEFFIDTLNRAFAQEQYSKEQVQQGLVNPNAVNCYIQFVAAENPPPGKTLSSTGLNKIKLVEDEEPVLPLSRFQGLEETHAWDPNEYINIWIAEGFEFEFPPVNPNETMGSGGARGLVYAPYLDGVQLPGLVTEGVNPKFPDLSTLSQGILLRSGSLLGNHPDFIINRIGYYLGLFDTLAFGCEAEGDFCKDTFAPDISQPSGPLNQFKVCEDGPYYIPNNHMSIGRQYTNFTFDQRARMHFVLQHALYRPNGL